MSSTTDMDRNLKMNVINDAFNVVVPPDWMDDNSKHGANTSKETQVGSFTLMIDETGPEGQSTKATKIDKAVRRGTSNTLWR